MTNGSSRSDKEARREQGRGDSDRGEETERETDSDTSINAFIVASSAAHVYTECRAGIINIQEALDQILFTPAVINRGIDVPADTDVPWQRPSNRLHQPRHVHCTYGT